MEMESYKETDGLRPEYYTDDIYYYTLTIYYY